MPRFQIEAIEIVKHHITYGVDANSLDEAMRKVYEQMVGVDELDDDGGTYEATEKVYYVDDDTETRYGYNALTGTSYPMKDEGQFDA